jgi:hypothetical protein
MRASHVLGPLLAIVLGIAAQAASAQTPNNQHGAKAPPKAAPVRTNAVPRAPTAGVRQTPGPQQVRGNPGQPSRTVVAHGGPNRAVQGAHASIGGHGYRYGGHGVRREMHTLNREERLGWQGGRWHHERRFGRDGYWWEVNGSWYWYSTPMSGPPAYVSEYEFMDPTPAPAVVYGAPVVVAPPPASPEAILGGVIGGAIGGMLSGH